MHRTHLSKRIFPTLVFCLLALRPQAHGFENYEHAFIGDMSLKLAKKLFIERNPCKLSPEKLELISQAADSLLTGAQKLPKSGKLLTYGVICELPDHQFTPIHSHARIGANGIELGLNLAEIDEKLSDTASSMHLLGNNGDHFGEAAMRTYLHYHAVAKSMAAKDLGSALAFNAFGDHFLQDLHAPGHIVADHTINHDGNVLAVHDYYNIQGMRAAVDVAKFAEPDDANTPSVREVLEFVARHSRSDSLKRAALELCGAGNSQATERHLTLYGDGKLYRSSQQTAYLLSQNILSIYRVLLSSCNIETVQNPQYFSTESNPETMQTITRVGAITYEYNQIQSSRSARDYSLQIGRVFSLKSSQFSSEGRIVLGIPMRNLKSDTSPYSYKLLPSEFMYISGGYAFNMDETYDELRSAGFEWKLSFLLKDMNVGFSLTLSPQFHDLFDSWRWDYGASVYTGFSILSVETGMRHHNFEQKGYLGHGMDADWSPYVGISLHNIKGASRRLKNWVFGNRHADAFNAMAAKELK